MTQQHPGVQVYQPRVEAAKSSASPLRYQPLRNSGNEVKAPSPPESDRLEIPQNRREMR